MTDVHFTVLGASGYVGSHLVAYLRSCGYAVWAPAKGDTEIFARPLGRVFYCVGLTADFRTRPFETVEAHIGFLADVLQRAQFDALLYLSSTRVYMGGISTHEDAPLTVRPADPSYLYNLSKLAGESLCHACNKQGVRVVRLSNVVGSGMESQSGNFIASLLSEARTGKILLRSDLESAKDYIHIDDVVKGLLLVSLNGSAGIYNLASGENTTHKHWMAWMRQYQGCSFSVELNAPLQYFPVIDVGRLQKDIGFYARTVLNSGEISIKKQRKNI